MRLIEERKDRRWSQQEIANFVGTTQHNVSRWEQGTTNPGHYFRNKLCELFGKSEEELGLSERGFPLLPTAEKSMEMTPTISSPTNADALWTVPYTRNPYFTGRDELLQQLAHHFSAARHRDVMNTHRVALTQPQALKGLGGIGKTQIAVEYAYRAREQGLYDHILWINAANEETIIADLVALAKMLPNFPTKGEKDQQKVTAAIKRWLEQCKQGWLLIFDNADDLALPQKYLPLQGHGNLLFTTRANAIAANAASIEVENMGLIEGTMFLLQRAQRQCVSDEERDAATNVVIELDGFPLALDQACAYIEETQCSFNDYLQLYQSHRKALLARRGTQSTNYPDSVATTWSLSFQKVQQVNPAAAELLRLCALLAPDHIPEELLRDGANYWPPLLQQAAGELYTFNHMLEVLLTFSLVKRLPRNHLLSINRMVQVVQRNMMEPEEQRQWAERLVYAVNRMFPGRPREEIHTWPLCIRYLEQVQACDTLIQQYGLESVEAADILERTGRYLHARSLYDLAEPLFQRALRIREHISGPCHLEVALSLYYLAVLYAEQGRYAETEPLLLCALHIRENALGSEHLLLAPILNNLAELYTQQGRYAETEPLLLRALHIRENALGSEHLLLAPILNNLADFYTQQGKYPQAEPLYWSALRIWEQAQRPEDLLLAYPLNNLAELYITQGNYTQTEILPQSALHIRESTPSSEKPLLAYPLSNLAVIYSKQGRHEEAEALFQKALHAREYSQGSDHPDIAYPLTGLARLYQEQKKYDAAELLYLQALRIGESTLRPDHPDLVETLYGFAILREMQGQMPEAITLYTRAFAIRKQIFGLHHPKTTEIHNRLRSVLAISGQIEETGVLNIEQS
ncbi:MAG TPA: FxSxx-COOH system tetratricopeptide repeat protein [Ktedonobacteraceae bacterium]